MLIETGVDKYADTALCDEGIFDMQIKVVPRIARPFGMCFFL